MTTRPAGADRMIDGGREAMTEMRRLVDVLAPRRRAGDNGGELGPPPGLADLPELCDRLRAGGLPLDVHIDVAMQPRRTAGITAYRIVQEALTNVVKHAGQVATRVDIRGTSPAARSAGHQRPGLPRLRAGLGSGGHGLDGIRRRAALFGGEVFAGPVPGGGYALRATLLLRRALMNDPRPDRRRPAADAAGVRYDPLRSARHRGRR